MRYLPLHIVAVAITSATVCHAVIANENPVAGDLTSADIPAAAETVLSAKSDSLPPGADTTDAMGAAKDIQAEMALMVGEPVTDGESDQLIEPDSRTTSAEAEAIRDREEVWAEISQAISGLNDMVGDEMFRDLRRTDSNRMEVRLDLDYWQRVRYETRVDLKNDISNIWHLYVLQYSTDRQSSVFFIDDHTDKTIDIFSKIQ